jgi:predicted methyltransferase
MQTMEDTSRAFLRALYSIAASKGGALLSHDEVNALGETLRIPRPEFLDVIGKMQLERLVAVSFGGLSLTPDGKALAAEMDETGARGSTETQ